MAIRKIPFVSNEYYHLFSRGNNKREIFLDENDYKHFVKCLFVCNTSKNFRFREDIIEQNLSAFDFDRGDPLVSIGAWVLMPNHFHLYLRIPPMSDIGEGKKEKQKNDVSEFMRKLLTAYTKYFNAKHERSGGLYEGPFKSVHIEDDNHAKYIFSYIHLNPVKLIDSQWKEEGITNEKLALEYLNSYRWSSYPDHRGVQRPENKILSLKDFPTYFSNVKEFDSEILSWLRHE